MEFVAEVVFLKTGEPILDSDTLGRMSILRIINLSREGNDLGNILDDAFRVVAQMAFLAGFFCRL